MSGRVQAVFEQVFDLSPDERRAALEEACGEDETLRSEVESLLEAHDNAGGFLGSPTADATALLKYADSSAADEPTQALSSHGEQAVVPKRLGPVRLVREIGQGGMGSVWLGRDEVLQRDVAVKFVLNITASKDSKEVELFIEGARAAAAIDHPGLTTIHHADVVDDVPYLVMDYVRGASLGDVLRQHGPLTVEQTAAVLDAACEVLSALHDAEIVHRDIKPSNILISRDGRLLVTDFGLACDRVQPGRSVRVKGLMGTPYYMAPEMFDGVISPRTDIYALGVTAYELLTGETPFSGKSQLRREGEARALPRKELEERDVPPALIDLIERMTNSNAMFRIKSARQVQQILAKAEVLTRVPGEKLFADLLTGVGPAKQRDDGSSSSDAGASTSDLATLAEQKRRTKHQVEPDARTEPVYSPRTKDDGKRSTEAIPASIPCIKCGYDLNGLPAGSRCSECGLPIAESLSPDRVLLAPPEVIRRIALGARLVGWGIVGLILFWISLPVLIGLERAFGLEGAWDGQEYQFWHRHQGGIVSLLGYSTIHIAALITLFLGLWHLTVPRAASRRARSIRRIVRAFSTATFVGGVIGWLSWITMNLPAAPSPDGFFARLPLAMAYTMADEAAYLCLALALLMLPRLWSDLASQRMWWLSQLSAWAVLLAVIIAAFMNPMFYQLQSYSQELIAAWVQAMLVMFPALLIAAAIILGLLWTASAFIAFTAKFVSWFIFRRLHKQLLTRVAAAEPLRRFATVFDSPPGARTR